MINAFHLLDTGYCRALEAAVIRGGRLRQMDCHALVALLHHPREGWLLFDTGYAPRLTDATARWPFRLYRYLLPARSVNPVVAQLLRFGLTPGDIKTLVVSHFHPDHTGGLKDFPQTRFVCAREAWEGASSVRGGTALRQGMLPDLLPDDFGARATLLGDFTGPELPHVGLTHDLFGDNSVCLVRLPGHARGQIGLYAPQTPAGPVFLVADASYLTRSLRDGVGLSPFTNLIADDARAVADTIARLHRFHQAQPDVTLLPTHCPEAFARVG